MTSPTRPAGDDARPERRAHPRIPADAVPYLQAHVAGGPPVQLLDLAKRGVQIATTLHMRPGSTVVIRFLSREASLTMTSAVVRSSVAVVETSGQVTYHTALAFTDELTLCSAELDQPAAADVPRSPATAAPAAGPEDYTMIVQDSRLGMPSRLGAGEAR